MPVQTRQQLCKQFWDLFFELEKDGLENCDILAHYMMDYEKGKDIRHLIKCLEKEIKEQSNLTK